jgi:hypothetical protein
MRFVKVGFFFFGSTGVNIYIFLHFVFCISLYSLSSFIFLERGEWVGEWSRISHSGHARGDIRFGG